MNVPISDEEFEKFHQFALEGAAQYEAGLQPDLTEYIAWITELVERLDGPLQKDDTDISFTA